MGFTMPPMPSQIDIYEAMSTLSARMVEAARSQDWANLVALEKSVAALRQTLLADDDSSRLSAAEIDLKHALIQRILDDDAEIRRHTEPWMEHLRKYLGDSAQRRQVGRAYGASA
jgi:flagellar protein FliT